MSVTDRDILVRDLIDRVDALEYGLTALLEYVIAPPQAGTAPEQEDWNQISGWVTTGTALRDLDGKIVLDPTIPMIQIASGGYIQSSDYATGSQGFSIDGGTAEFNDVTVRGTIFADLGEIAGWSIATTTLAKNNATLSSDGYLLLGTGNDIVELSAVDATYRIWVGNAAAASAPFRVTKAGAVTATNATVTGTINADAGYLDTLDITGVLTAGVLPPTVQIDGPNKYIGTSDFVTGQTGWRIEGEGNAEFNQIKIRGELSAAVYTYDLIISTAGSIHVAKSAGMLSADVTVTGTTFTVNVENPPSGTWLFATGDIVLIRDYNTAAASITATWATVTQGTLGSDTQSYTATYQSGQSSGIYRAGAAITDYGTSGQGYLVMTADQSNAPYYDVRTHAGAPWTTETIKTRVGNLAGVSDPDLSPSGYGLYSDNAYLKGDLNAASGKVKINTNGITILEGLTAASGVRWVGSDGEEDAGIYTVTLGGVPLLQLQSPWNIAGTHQYGQIQLAAYDNSTYLYILLNPVSDVISFGGNTTAPVYRFLHSTSDWLEIDPPNSRLRFYPSGTERGRIRALANVFDIDVLPDSTATGQIRLFRSTNTTGTKALQLYKGDGGGTVHTQIGVDGTDTYFTNTDVTIGATSGAYPLTIYQPTTDTRGISLYIDNDGDPATTQYGAYITVDRNTPSGTYNNIGLRINSVTGGNGNWGFYIADSSAENYIANKLSIGATTAAYSSKLYVAGKLAATGPVSQHIPFASYAALPFGMSTTNTIVWGASVGRDGTVTSYYLSVYIATTNDASNYWNFLLRTVSGTSIQTINTQSLAPNTWHVISASPSFSYTNSTHKGLMVTATKTGSPGAMYGQTPGVYII